MNSPLCGTPPPNGPGPRLRHCHSSPQGASPRKKLFSLERSDAKASNFMFSSKRKSHESATDRRKIGVLGVPPNDPPERQGPRGLDPVIDLKYLWRSLRSVPHRRWGPPEHKPRDLARAAAPRSRSSQRFPQSWGRIVRPEPKGFVAPRHLQPPVKASANPRNPRISVPTSKIPYLWGPPGFKLSDGSQNFRVVVVLSSSTCLLP